MVDMRDFFIPEHCIQGEQISSHLMWESKDFIDLKIIIPKGWKYTEVCNVKEDDFSVDKNELLIKKTQLPGYLAISMKTSRYKKPNVTQKLLCIFNGDENYQYSRDIYLFRPDIQTKLPSKEIVLFVSQEGNYSFNEYIKLANRGEGIAFINIEESKKSEIKLKNITENQEFIFNIVKDMEKKLPKLQYKFPKYSNLIDRFLDFIKKQQSFDEKRLNEIRRLNDDFEVAIEEDWNFIEEFIGIIVSIYISNINLITPFSSFLNYLKSMRKNNVYLTNSLSIFDIKKDGVFRGELQVTDMAFNKYKTIPIKIRIKAKKEIQVPLYSLLKWKDVGGK